MAGIEAPFSVGSLKTGSIRLIDKYNDKSGQVIIREALANRRMKKKGDLTTK